MTTSTIPVWLNVDALASPAERAQIGEAIDELRPNVAAAAATVRSVEATVAAVQARYSDIAATEEMFEMLDPITHCGEWVLLAGTIGDLAHAMKEAARGQVWGAR